MIEDLIESTLNPVSIDERIEVEKECNERNADFNLNHEYTERSAEGRMLVTTGKILDAWDNDQFKAIVVYGPLRYGKSSYSLKVLHEVYDTWDWDTLKTHLVYTAQEFMSKIKNTHKKEKCLLWDDAGVFLFNLDTNDPFIKSVTKWFALVGTQFASVIFTTPSPQWIVRKIRFLPQTTYIKITKSAGSDAEHRHSRDATGYLNWIAPDFRKSGVKKVYIDHFNVMLPDKLYKCYKPFRESYVTQLQGMMDTELSKQTKLKLKGAPDESVYEGVV
jgi:hypothetical protein